MWGYFLGQCKWLTHPQGLREAWQSKDQLLTNLGITVLIWAPLSRRAMQLSPLSLTLATFSILYHQLKGWDSRRESPFGILCLEHPFLGHLWCGHLSLRGLVSLPWYCPLLLVWRHIYLSSWQPWAIMDEVVWAVTVITMLLCLLCLLHCSSKMHYEFLSYPFDAIWVVTISDFLLIGAFLL